jgi:hypothetical protein
MTPFPSPLGFDISEAIVRRPFAAAALSEDDLATEQIDLIDQNLSGTLAS